MEDVRGKVAFITGAASGLGLAMVRSFAAAGMRVVAADIEEGALAKVEEEFAASNREIMTVKLDVTNRDAMAEAAAATIEHFGKVHVLVNNAGVGVGGKLDEMTYNDWDWVLSVNLDGVINGLQSFVGLIKKHGEGGHIVNTASMAGHLAVPGLGVYNASKFAVVAISESLRTDLADKDIGVSVLCPGLVDTNIFESGRNRPDTLQSKTGSDSLVAAISDGPDSSGRLEEIRATALAPSVVGDMVLHAIRENEMYIFTHPELEESVNQRAAGISDSFARWRAYRADHDV